MRWPGDSSLDAGARWAAVRGAHARRVQLPAAPGRREKPRLLRLVHKEQDLTEHTHAHAGENSNLVGYSLLSLRANIEWGVGW